jgi:hypothetical protein
LLKFYLSPSGMNYFEYTNISRDIEKLGWEHTFSWSQKNFQSTFIPSSTFAENIALGISRADLFCAFLPGTMNTQMEIGLAYAWCREIVLSAPDSCYFEDPTAESCLYVELPEVTRFTCLRTDLPAYLKDNYFYLVDIPIPV